MDLLNLKLAYPKRTIQIVLFGIAVFSFVGCSSTKPAPKPEETAQAQKPEASTKGQTNAPVDQSSLEQLQQRAKVRTEGPLKDIYFDFDRYDLREDARATLKGNAEWLKKNASATAKIKGHCNERNTTEYNLALKT